MREQLPVSRPMKTYSEQDLLKDSDVWDYLKYLQLNRINFLSTTIWDSDRLARNQLMNLLAAVQQLEFLCWDKIAISKEKWLEYVKRKPDLFRSFDKTQQEIEGKINGTQMEQFMLYIEINSWLKLLDKYFSTMKKMKKTVFVSGVGEAGMSEASES